MNSRRTRTTCFLVLTAAYTCTGCRRAAPPPAPIEMTTLSEMRARKADPEFMRAPDGRLIVGRGEDYQPINEPPDALAAEMRDSMQRRRQRAWQIVEAVIRPATLAAGEGRLQLPVWQTWYKTDPEIGDILHLYFTKLKATPGANREQLAEQVFHEYAERDLAERLKDQAFQERLKQFEGSPELTAGVNGTGFTMFSPSFVKHVLLEAQGTETCPFDVPSHERPEALPPPAGINNFSSCVLEFPRSAVMVKTTWRPLDAGLLDHDTGEAAMRDVIKRGTWPASRLVQPAPGSVYTLTTESGVRMGLTGIHFVTKDVREWVWVTLWWDPEPNTDFGGDRPQSVAQYNNGVWTNYKMCAAASFDEGDRTPWAGFSDGSLTGALRGIHEETTAQTGRTRPVWPAEWRSVPRFSNPTTWCSNPNVETHPGNGRTNCIGCHQFPNTTNDRTGQITRFSNTLSVDDRLADFPQNGRAQYRDNFPAEFAWSFLFEFKSAIEAARRAAGFEWPSNPPDAGGGSRR
jgi:hypothetical protein